MAQRRPPIGTVEEVIPALGKYRFKYDFSNSATIFCITTPCPSIQGSNFSKGDVVNAVGFLSRDGGDYRFPDYNYLDVQNVKYDPSKATSFSDNPKTIIVPIYVLEKVNDSTPVDLQTGLNFGQNPQPTSGSSVIVENPIDVIPVKANSYVEPKPYLVVQDFIIYSRWENRMGQSGVQEFTYSKGDVIFLPTATHQDQFDIALKDGKLKELPIVSVVSLVDRQTGKCKTDGALLQTTDYNPCRTVKKGEKLIGYIANGVFTNTNKDIMKPQLYIGEYELIQTNSGSFEYSTTDDQNVIRLKNDNQKTLLIIGIVVAGYLLFTKKE